MEQILVGNQIKIMFLILYYDDGDHKCILPSVINYLQRLKRSPKISMISPLNRVRFTGNGNIKVIGDESNFNTILLIISFIHSTNLIHSCLVDIILFLVHRSGMEMAYRVLITIIINDAKMV